MSRERVSLVEISRGINYGCPNCGTTPPEQEEFVFDNTKDDYPKFVNERKGGNEYGSYHDWEEIHKCLNCQQIYWFTNGAY